MRVYTSLVVAGILLLIWRPWIPPQESSAPPGPETAPYVPPPPPPDPAPDSPPSSGAGVSPVSTAPHVDPKRSPLADALNAPDRGIDDDLRTVGELLAHFRSVFGENPTGSNREITSALSGRNSKFFAPLPRDHDAISDAGELLDRWGTPYFFHNLSAACIELRSAGPDQTLWTPDDASFSNAPLSAER